MTSQRIFGMNNIAKNINSYSHEILSLASKFCKNVQPLLSNSLCKLCLHHFFSAPPPTCNRNYNKCSQPKLRPRFTDAKTRWSLVAYSQAECMCDDCRRSADEAVALWSVSNEPRPPPVTLMGHNVINLNLNGEVYVRPL